MRSEFRSTLAPSFRTLSGCVLCMALAIADTSMAGSIFDDDWAPPKAVERPADPAPPAEAPQKIDAPKGPSVAAPTEPKPAPKVIVPSDLPPAPVARSPEPVRIPSRLAVPGQTQLATSRSLFKEAFAEQLKDHAVPARGKFAQLLLGKAANTEQSPSDRFALLAGAIQAGKEGANLPVCLTAADMMAKIFEVDDLSIKLGAATQMKLLADSQPATLENVNAGMELVVALIEIEDFPDALRLMSLLRPIAADDASLKSSIQRQTQKVEQIQAARVRVQPYMDKLKAAPDDPIANFEVGCYLCLKLGQWERGLPLLAHGSNPKVKKLASFELSRPTTTEERVHLGDVWWGVANAADLSRDPFARHAATIYSSLLDDVTGIQKDVLQGRIAKATISQTPAKATSLVEAARGHQYEVGWSGGLTHADKSRPIFYRVTSIKVTGESVTIQYEWKAGVVTGRMSGKELFGTWTQSNARGDCYLHFNEDFTAAEGWWNGGGDKPKEIMRLK